jgi:putative membrane protein
VIGALVALAAGGYAYGVSRRDRAWPLRRSAAFAAGLLALAVALLAPDGGLTAHMLEHVALALVAAPLLVLGAPHALFARELARPLRALGAVTWWPVAFVLFSAALLAVHLTPLFDLALDHAWAHALEHGLLLGAALLFWFPVLAAPPAPRRLGPVARLGYLLAAMAPMGALGAALGNGGEPVYARYSLAEQAEAGAVMWVAGGTLLALVTVAAAWEAMVVEERRQRRREEVGSRVAGRGSRAGDRRPQTADRGRSVV